MTALQDGTLLGRSRGRLDLGRGLGRCLIPRMLGALASLFAVLDSASAAEPTTELPAGGLTYAGPPKLKTEREDVVIAADLVRLTYIVRNVTGTPNTATLAFALPDIDMLALDGAPIENPAFDAKNPGNFVGFSATVDGQPPDLFIQSTVLQLGLIDATQTILAQKLPLYPFDPELTDRLNALSPDTKADLVARSLVRQVDGQIEPLWTLRSAMFWQQAFAPNQTRTIAAVYRPVAGTTLWTSDTAADLQRQFCVPEAAAKQLSARATTNGPASVRWVNFVAHGSAQARGPATQSRLAIEAGAKGQAFTCREGLTGAITGTREVVANNHISDGEIQVLFVD